MSQVTSVGKTKTHDPVLRVDQGSERGKVGSGSRVRLNVDSPDLGVEVERLEGSLSAQVLEDIDVLVTSVVSGTGKTLGVLVGKHGSVGFHDGQRGQVLSRSTTSTISHPKAAVRPHCPVLTSEAINSSPENCLQVSSSTILATSGSASARVV